MRISKSALLPYSAQQLFDLINDIESYPDFLDGCVAAEIVHRDADSLQARLELSKKGINQSFITRNTMVAAESIHMELVEGPFDSLTGDWTLTPLADEGCKLSLELDFAIKKGIIMQMIAKFFGEIGNKLVDAISAEAARRYGDPITGKQ